MRKPEVIFARTLSSLLIALFCLPALNQLRAAEFQFYAESGEGKTIARQGADTPINPASVIKVGTSLMALERLGEDYRYTTGFSCRGLCTISDGVLHGDLVIQGGSDPDFQAENAWLVARRLNEMGIREISGDLRIRAQFWIGWEHGMRHRVSDPRQHCRLVGGRLLNAWDPGQWENTLRASWEDAAPRHGWDPRGRPSLCINGTTRLDQADNALDQPLLRHHSNPLPVILKRFNTYSNNDIIRIAEPLGGPKSLQAFLRALSGDLPGKISISAASGEGVNRMTPRQLVRLLRALEAMCIRRHLSLTDLLPLPGCDPGPTARMFPRLVHGPRSRTALIKTGTLSTTDGGVAVLAGYVESGNSGRVAFCAAATRAGQTLRTWRHKEESWLLDLQTQNGGATPFSCGAAIPFSDSMCTIDILKTRRSP